MKKLVPFLLLVLISCGKTTTETSEVKLSSIINGSLIKDEDLASHSVVALVDMFGATHCSGTLISSNLILTGAHCVSQWVQKSAFERSKRIQMLERVTFKLNSSSEETTFHMDKVEMYPVKNEEDEQMHDIAVIKFTGSLPPEFKPAAILAPEYKLVKNTKLLLAGFGYTSDQQDIKDLATQTSYQIRIPYNKTMHGVLVLTQTNSKEGAYHGDSGGPAYLETGKELLLAGSTIGGFDNEPEVYYTNVSAHKKFILNAAKNLDGEAPVFKMPNK